MEFEVLGDASDGPTLDLDHRHFRYAGKFITSNTGKAVARCDGEVVAAIAYNRDRTDDQTARIRYITVRDDVRGEEVGARLAGLTAEYLLEDVAVVKIAVNNPFAYEALYKAGFGFTGEETGIAELVLSRPGDRSRETYQNGLEVFGTRDTLSREERVFIRERDGEDPPARLPESD